MADNSVYNIRSLSYPEILKRNLQLSKAVEGKVFSVNILSNITVNPIKEVLEYKLRTLSLKPVITFGNYDNIVQESFTLEHADLIIVFYELINLGENFNIAAELLAEDELTAVVAKCKQDIDIIFENLKGMPFVIFNGFSSAAFSTPVHSKKNVDSIENELNEWLIDKKRENIHLVDLNKLVLSIGHDNAFDKTKFLKYKSLYKIEFLKLYVSSIENLLLRRAGKLKKALVFDCDNTLWKGVIGEDGPSGIDMSAKSDIGKNFNLVQQIAASLSVKGILVCLCSKNDLHEVVDLFGKHADMVIDLRHIVTHRINWKNKPENLREIAIELNIGLDSIIFIDDADFEINLIRDQIPEILSFSVTENLDEYPSMILEIAQRYFNLEPLKEDLQKVQIYKEQAKRVDAMNRISNIDTYLSTLGTRIIVKKNDKEQISRIAQLTQKTNQFNLTTTRYSETEIVNLVNDPQTCIFTFDVSDKFGDSGITAVLILKESLLGKEIVEIDTFLLSCRILGRKIETKIINYIMYYCKNKNYKTVKATYKKTNKNSQVKDFYLNNGFTVINVSEDALYFTSDLDNLKYSEIEFIKLIEE